MIDKLFLNRLNSLCTARPCKVTEFPSKLKERLGTYKELLNNYDIVGDEKSGISDTIDRLIESITDAVELVYNGKPSAAYGKMNSLVPSLGKFIHQIEAGHSFYRMRSVYGMEKNKIEYKEMFHIPFDKRGIVTTQRYSIPGYPCLYLGEHSYGCWEELGQPDLDSCLVSRLENTKPLRLWDLRMPTLENLQEPVFGPFSLMLFPLVIACMFKVDDANVAFKPEYIIPQILMQLLIDSPGIDGIIYTSVHKNKVYGFPDFVFTNYVIPVKEYHKENLYCPQLCDIFRITKPTCEEYLKIQHGSDLAPDSDTIFIDTEWTPQMRKAVYAYSRSLFGNIEKWLQDESHFKMNTIKPQK